MRTIRTFVLRLLVDTEEPDVLRGAVQCVASASEHPFTSDRSLLDILRQVSHAQEADSHNLSESARGGER